MHSALQQYRVATTDENAAVPTNISHRQTDRLWKQIRSELRALAVSDHLTTSTNTHFPSLEALIKAKGGVLELNGLEDCDDVFENKSPNEDLAYFLGNLQFNADNSLPAKILAELQNFRETSATKAAYNDLYARLVFPQQQPLPKRETVVVRRMGEPALQSTTNDDRQPSPPTISAGGNCVPPGPKPYCTGKDASLRDRQQPVTVTTASVSAKVASVAQSGTESTDLYCDFIITIQYWLSEEVLDPSLQKRAKAWVPKLFNGSPYYSPYLTAIMVDQGSKGKSEHRLRLIAAMSIALHQRHLLFEASERHEARYSQGGNTKSSLDKPEYLTLRNWHYGILIDGSDFEVFVCRPLLVTDTTDWNGFKADRLANTSLKTLDDVRTLLHWVSSIHRWGLIVPVNNLKTDLGKFQRNKVGGRSSLCAYDDGKSSSG
ncbi:hypothetical protein MMC17_005330 [Xylographa soralifera]|nr:hypothetical protein [Xylographa soralifera]